MFRSLPQVPANLNVAKEIVWMGPFTGSVMRSLMTKVSPMQ